MIEQSVEETHVTLYKVWPRLKRWWSQTIWLTQGAYYAGAVAGQVTETEAAIQYISTLANDHYKIIQLLHYPSEQQIIDTSLTAEATAYTNLDALVDLVAYAS